MSAHPFGPQPTPPADRLRLFEAAIGEYAKARVDISEYGGHLAMHTGPVVGPDRDRLTELALAQHLAGERLKALAMTLVTEGLLDRCIDVLEAQADG